MCCWRASSSAARRAGPLRRQASSCVGYRSRIRCAVLRRPTSRGKQPRIAPAERFVAAALQHIAVGDHDAVEVPTEYALQALARRPAIADQERVELGGAEPAVAPQQS